MIDHTVTWISVLIKKDQIKFLKYRRLSSSHVSANSQLLNIKITKVDGSVSHYNRYMKFHNFKHCWVHKSIQKSIKKSRKKNKLKSEDSSISQSIFYRANQVISTFYLCFISHLTYTSLKLLLQKTFSENSIETLLYISSSSKVYIPALYCSIRSNQRLNK